MKTKGRTTGDVDAAVRTVERVCADAGGPDELFERLSHEIRAFVPHDASTWFGADPVTMLAAAPSRVEGFEDASCPPFWHQEFFEHDASLWVDLARSPVPVAALRLTLDDRPGRSGRYREIMKPHGYEDELRGVLRAGDSTWGMYGLYREGCHPAFDEHEVAVMAAIGGMVAAALRTHVRSCNPWLGQTLAPGLVMFDRDGRVVSANREAQLWVGAIAGGDPSDGEPGPVLERSLHDESVEIASPLSALVTRARAVEAGIEPGPARLRVRDRRGRWLVLHASSLAGPASGDGTVAVVIEPAKSAEVAPIIIDAYSLTPREREVLAALARGGTTSEIAGELFLSPHTVRDHIKTVFEKVGVSSRSELVAKLYAEHYSDRYHATLVHGD